MKIEFDTLKCAKILLSKGFTQPQAEALASTLGGTEIRNLYGKTEVNNMLAEAVQNVFKHWDKQWEQRLSVMEKRVDSEIAEARAGRRWVIGTIITVGFALAGYLSALIHFAH